MNDHREISGGALTGATGDLTPDDTDRTFEPGERREIADAAHHADVTRSQARRTSAPNGDADQASARIGGDELSEEEERL